MIDSYKVKTKALDLAKEYFKKLTTIYNQSRLSVNLFSIFGCRFKNR